MMFLIEYIPNKGYKPYREMWATHIGEILDGLIGLLCFGIFRGSFAYHTVRLRLSKEVRRVEDS
jgi:hypothetical protein